MRARPTLMLAELVDPDNRLDPQAWARAHLDRTAVARCGCGGPVYTDDQEPEYVIHFGVRWYAMRCDTCGHPTELPGTRVLKTTGPRPSLAGAAIARDVERRRLAEHE